MKQIVLHIICWKVVLRIRKQSLFVLTSLIFASWSSVAKNNCWKFKLDELKELFSLLLDNIYVKFRDNIYKQVVGWNANNLLSPRPNYL